MSEISNDKLQQALENIIERMIELGMLPPNLSKEDVKDLAKKVMDNIKNSSQKLDLSPEALKSDKGVKALVASVFCTVALEKHSELQSRFDLGRLFLDETHTEKKELTDDMKDDLKKLLMLGLEEMNALRPKPLPAKELEEATEEALELMAKVLMDVKLEEHQDKLLTATLQNLFGGIDSRKAGQMISPQASFIGNLCAIPLQASPSATSTAPIADITNPTAKLDPTGTKNTVQNLFDALGLFVAGPGLDHLLKSSAPKPQPGGKAQQSG